MDVKTLPRPTSSGPLSCSNGAWISVAPVAVRARYRAVGRGSLGTRNVVGRRMEDLAGATAGFCLTPRGDASPLLPRTMEFTASARGQDFMAIYRELADPGERLVTK